MSASLATDTTALHTAERAAHSGFLSLPRAELFKIGHLRITWVLMGVYTVIVVGLQLVLASGPNNAAQLRGDPLGAFYNVMEGDFSIVRILSGIVLLVLAAHVIGLEYQLGTIRILLGRGIGRLQLLGAKVAALALVALAVMTFGLLIELVFSWAIVAASAGNANPWRVLGTEFWTDVRFYALCLLINAGATLLLGVAASAVGRSLSFGLAVGLSWFAVDNLASIPLSLLFQVTHSDFWRNLSSFLLGPLLNRLPDYIAPPYHTTTHGPHGTVVVAHAVSGFGALPLVSVSGGHALAVILAYSLVFAAAAIVTTWRRDVLE